MSMERTSTSFFSSTPQWKYDVFLSFRGDDTRKGFTDHLYAALVHHGIITFKDDPELQKGKTISPELFTAIQESRFALIVLSENYASSKWCLDELLQILECMEARETVLPIFYDVDPSDVRKQAGSFADAFAKHEKKLRDGTEKVQRWRDALTKVANFSGWDSKDWYESKLIKDIVECIWKKVRPTLSSHVEDLVGIDSRLEPINLYLDGRVDDVCFIGIWGMGGIGKTTTARAFYQRNSHEFDFHIFLANVRNIVEESGLVHLQKKLLCKIRLENDDLLDVGEGAIRIRRLLCGKKVLLVLDDVNHLDQLKYLAGNHQWFGCGSRVFITTRNEHLLIQHGVERRFEVERLSKDEALQLFCRKAFKKDYPKQIYVDLCNGVVSYANGLPLALEVLGSFLHGRGQNAWNSALGKLREVLNPEIFDTLKISYDCLDDKQKKVFLDIACFFNGKRMDEVIKLLDSCGFYTCIEIEVLCERSLLTVSRRKIVWMHDLLQEMGREIVRREFPDDPGRRSRLWLYKDVNYVLSKNTGTEAVGGMVIHQGRVQINGKSFSMMKRLKLIIIDYCCEVDLSNGLEYLPSSLRILKWPKFPLKSLPTSFNPDDLVDLSMRHSRLEHVFQGMKPSYNCNLKSIDLSHSLSLVKTPDFRCIPCLEHLTLEGCTRLYEVDSSVGELRRLTLMNLKDCKSLVHLPSSVNGLKSLKVLNVSGCLKLEKLPRDLGHVECLEELDVSGTAIREPPSSIGLLRNLKVVFLRGCKGPSSKAWDIMLFPFRPLLKLRPHPAALWLPSLSGLHSLTKLDLRDCNLLEGVIPNDLGCLSSLRWLNLSGNQFVSLPRSICQLSQLEHLDVSNCYRLGTLPELPSSISRVQAYNSNSLETSSVDKAKLLTNFFKLVERHGCIRFDFIVPPCYYVAPGNEIPRWFNHKSEGSSSVCVELHPGWYSHKWMGFSLCVVFGLVGSQRFCSLVCQLSVNGRPLDSFPLFLPSDHVCLIYLPRHQRDVYELQTNSYTRLEFSFSFQESLSSVRKCGVHLVYEEDTEEGNFEKATAVSASVSESGVIGRISSEKIKTTLVILDHELNNIPSHCLGGLMDCPPE